MKPRFDLTPEERWERIGELLYKGIYLLVMEDQCKTNPIVGFEDKLEGPLLNVSKTAQRLGVSRRTLQRWIRKGFIHCDRRNNGYPMIHTQELAKLKALIKERRIKGALFQDKDVLSLQTP